MSTHDHRGREVAIEAHGARLLAFLDAPSGARGLVIFVHGTGSDRYSGRNHHVARRLAGDGLATLVMDLLTEAEQEGAAAGGRQPDLPALAGRVAETCRWATERPETRSLPLGLFGSSTGAAVALLAAAGRPDLVRAVVSRGGRPDLASTRLDAVTCPTLLVVGEHDAMVLDINREAAAKIAGEVDLQVVAGASHLFEEPGKLDEVAELTRTWFARHLAGA